MHNADAFTRITCRSVTVSFSLHGLVWLDEVMVRALNLRLRDERAASNAGTKRTIV